MGLPIGECLQRHTHRQYLAWQAWFALQWNRPQLRDYYLMMIAAEVRRTIAEHPRRVDMKDFKLEFRMENDSPAAKLSREQAAAFARAKWLGRMTAPVRQAAKQGEAHG